VGTPNSDSTSLWPYRRAILREVGGSLWGFVKEHFLWELGFAALVLAVVYFVFLPNSQQPAAGREKQTFGEQALSSLEATAVVLGVLLFLVALIQLLDAAARTLQRQTEPEHHDTSLKIGEITGSEVDAKFLERFGSVEIKKASDCNFKTGDQGDESSDSAGGS
jgi:hypothetical protein